MKEEKDNLTPEIILIDISNGFQKLKRLGVDRKIINDTGNLILIVIILISI